MLALVACSALLVVGSDTPPPADVQQAYQTAKAGVGRSSDEQVKLALWCESHGLTTQRLHHLTLAILADPKNAAARGLMGLVAYNGRWLRPEAVAEKLKNDPDRAATLAEYEAKRLHAPYTADAQWTLGVWADEHGLTEQAKAHLTAVIRLDPKREAAWKKLGYKKHEGRWITEGQIVAEKAESDAQKAADKVWRPRIDHYKSMLDRPANRDEAEAALAGVTDPRAVPAIVSAFAKDRPKDQLRAVQLLGQIESPAASKTLAGLAVFSKSAEVRRSAVETLKQRDPRDFVKLWIALVHQPIKYQVKPVGGPGSPGTLEIEGNTAKLQRRYSPPEMPDVKIEPGARLTYDANGLPVLTERLGTTQDAGRVVWLPFYSFDSPQLVATVTQAVRTGHVSPNASGHSQSGRPLQTIAGYVPYVLLNGELTPLADNPNLLTNPNLTTRRNPVIDAQTNVRIPVGQMALEAGESAQAAQEQLKGDVAALDKVNAAIHQSNEPALLALRAITGQDLGDDPIAWGKWWTDQEGYVFAITQTAEKPTIFEDVPLAYTPVTVPQIVIQSAPSSSHHSCFAAGTSVRTIDGDRLIETIRAGDLVLVQDTKTGALGYQGVVAAYHNPPSPTLKISLGGSDAVVATGIHRFWKAGQGWTMARDLKVGDQVRTLGGVATVEAVGDDRIQPVFNLEVAEGHSFLVGNLGTLVHDNSLVEATPTPLRRRDEAREVRARDTLMADLKSRIERATESDANEVVRRLEAGETPKTLAQSLGMEVVDLIAAIARVGLGGEGAEGPALIQAAPKHPRLAKALTADALAGLLPGSGRPARLALAAGLLQILDFWDAGHTAAQEADDQGEAATAAYWHLIAHRREPDPGNAHYWARRVGRHPLHDSLAQAARPLLEAAGERTLNPDAPWSPPALIDLATRARPGTPQANLARKLQRLEMIYLLEESIDRVMGSG